MAGLGTLGLGSLITEITANEEEDQEEGRDSGSVDAAGQIQYEKQLCSNFARHRLGAQFQYFSSPRLGEKY